MYQKLKEHYPSRRTSHYHYVELLISIIIKEIVRLVLLVCTPQLPTHSHSLSKWGEILFNNKLNWNTLARWMLNKWKRNRHTEDVAGWMAPQVSNVWRVNGKSLLELVKCDKISTTKLSSFIVHCRTYHITKRYTKWFLSIGEFICGGCLATAKPVKAMKSYCIIWWLKRKFTIL